MTPHLVPLMIAHSRPSVNPSSGHIPPPSPWPPSAAQARHLPHPGKARSPASPQTRPKPHKQKAFPAHGEGGSRRMTEDILEVDIYLLNRYNKSMIVSFRDKETAKVYQQEFSKKLPQAIQRLALRKLMMIDNASSLNDLRIPPANHLEQLSGQRKDEYSIRINKQHRICFRMDSGNRFCDVQIEDYH